MSRFLDVFFPVPYVVFAFIVGRRAIREYRARQSAWRIAGFTFATALFVFGAIWQLLTKVLLVKF